MSMQPSIDEFITYPDALNNTLIFSKTSTKISFFFWPWVTGLLVASDTTKFGLMIPDPILD